MARNIHIYGSAQHLHNYNTLEAHPETCTEIQNQKRSIVYLGEPWHPQSEKKQRKPSAYRSYRKARLDIGQQKSRLEIKVPKNNENPHWTPNPNKHLEKVIINSKLPNISQKSPQSSLDSKQSKVTGSEGVNIPTLDLLTAYRQTWQGTAAEAYQSGNFETFDKRNYSYIEELNSLTSRMSQKQLDIMLKYSVQAETRQHSQPNSGKQTLKSGRRQSSRQKSRNGPIEDKRVSSSSNKRFSNLTNKRSSSRRIGQQNLLKTKFMDSRLIQPPTADLMNRHSLYVKPDVTNLMTADSIKITKLKTQTEKTTLNNTRPEPFQNVASRNQNLLQQESSEVFIPPAKTLERRVEMKHRKNVQSEINAQQMESMRINSYCISPLNDNGREAKQFRITSSIVQPSVIQPKNALESGNGIKSRPQTFSSKDETSPQYVLGPKKVLLQEQYSIAQNRVNRKVTDANKANQKKTQDNKLATGVNSKIQAKLDGAESNSPRQKMQIFGSNISSTRARQSSTNIPGPERLSTEPSSKPLNQSVYAESFQISKRDQQMPYSNASDGISNRLNQPPGQRYENTQQPIFVGRKSIPVSDQDPESTKNAYDLDWRHESFKHSQARTNQQHGKTNLNKNIYRLQSGALARNHAQVNFALDRSSEMIIPLTQSIGSPMSPSKLQNFSNSSAIIHQPAEVGLTPAEMQKKDRMLQAYEQALLNANNQVMPSDPELNSRSDLNSTEMPNRASPTKQFIDPMHVSQGFQGSDSKNKSNNFESVRCPSPLNSMQIRNFPWGIIPVQRDKAAFENLQTASFDSRQFHNRQKSHGVEQHQERSIDQNFYEYLKSQNLIEPNRSLSVQQKKFLSNQTQAAQNFINHVTNNKGSQGQSIAGFNQKLSSMYNSKPLNERSSSHNIDQFVQRDTQPFGTHERRYTHFTDSRQQNRHESQELQEIFEKLGYLNGLNDKTQFKLWNHYQHYQESISKFRKLQSGSGSEVESPAKKKQRPNTNTRSKVRLGASAGCDELSQMESTGKMTKESKDFQQLQEFIKKQVIKFYQQNLFHQAVAGDRGNIHCKGRTMSSHMKPGGSSQNSRRHDTRLRQRIESASNSNSQLHSPEFKNIDRHSSALSGERSSAQILKLNKQIKRQSHTGDGGQTEKKVQKKTRRSKIESAPFNVYTSQINEFVKVTLKFKETITQSHLQQIRKLGKQIGLKLGTDQLDAKFINSKDFVAILKSKIYCLLNQTVMGQSQIEMPTKPVQFKFFIEPSGNNHQAVRWIIKRRTWMNQQDLHNNAIAAWQGQSVQLVNLIWTQVRRPRVIKELQPHQIYNHVDGINEVGQKSNLFLNMREYYALKGQSVFDYMPETYLIQLENDFECDPQYRAFLQAYQDESEHMWIFKPGEASNRGFGIKVFNDLKKINAHIKEYLLSIDRQRGRFKNIILQRYITNPLLVYKRKFDIRVFALFVAHAKTGKIRGFFYEEGYLRTSSKEFDLEKFDSRMVHLTNDAVQKNSADYGKFESANKISYVDFDRILQKEKGVNFFTKVLPKIKALVIDVFEACGSIMYRGAKASANPARQPSQPDYSAFELMGFDFMMDDDLNLSLIEVNTNPCLDVPCLLLQRLIPQLLDQTLKVAVDPMLQATEHQYYMNPDFTVSELRYQMVYEAPIPKVSQDLMDCEIAGCASPQTVTEEEQNQRGQGRDGRASGTAQGQNSGSNQVMLL